MPFTPVITGAGAVTALGRGVEAFWEGLLAGRSGFAPVTLFDPARFAAKQAAEVADPPPDPEGVVTDRGQLFALAAAAEAVAAAGVRLGGARDGVVAGTTLGGNAHWTRRLDGAGGNGAGRADDGRAHADRTPDSARPGARDCAAAASTLQASTLHAATHLLARRHGLRGPAQTVSVACASGTAAIGLGAELIRRGEADRVLAGGYDGLSAFVFSGFDVLRALSVTRVRPFDVRRDGLGLGEGAGFVVLEEERAARARGATILARVAGYASAGDAHHMTRPSASGEGIARAIRAALCQARVTPDEIGFVNAHGTATTFNDRMEAAAFRDVFGARLGELPVNSIKSAVGHTLGAAGALEAILLTLVLTRGTVPPTAGFEHPDPACPLDVVAAPRPSNARYVLSTSSAFAGTNAALLLERV